MISAEAVPAWFEPAVRKVLNDVLTPVKRTAARSYNLQCRDGIARPFEIVPFLDGRLPTDQPHNLPALRNAEAIQGLSAQEVNTYMTGYGLDLTIQEPKRAIGREIGCVTRIH